MNTITIDGQRVEYYTDAYEARDALEAIRGNYYTVETRVHRKKVQVWNIPSAFDTEASSFMDNGEKRATMYAFMFQIGPVIYLGRNWKEYATITAIIADVFGTGDRVIFPVYVHNLSYDFVWICKHNTWREVFAIGPREPIRALTVTGIEYRCSLALTATNLAHIGESLNAHDVRKMVGDLDYTKVRTSETPLTAEEVGYCLNDVRVLTAYIEETIVQDGDITKIPMTKTGYVRRYVRDYCLNITEKDGTKKPDYAYIANIKKATLTPEIYAQLRRAFCGGFTHAGVRNSCRTFSGVVSMDFTSDYPSCLCSEKFPTGAPRKINVTSPRQFAELLKTKAVLIDIKITNLKEKFVYEHFLSVSKCRIKPEHMAETVTDNGRLVSCPELYTTLTNIDFLILRRFYSFDFCILGPVTVWDVDYLPRKFIECVLTFYEDKTTLKGIPEKETDYNLKKGMLNSVYGMCVASPCRPIYEYSDGWKEKQEPNIEESITGYNESRNRFYSYETGVFVTAFARAKLCRMILQLGPDYLYSDTDSVKVLNYEKHKELFEKESARITAKTRQCLIARGIDPARACPKTIKGKEKPLGVWDYDGGPFPNFRTLGSKRYLYSDEKGGLHLTLAGCSKKGGAEYLATKKDPFATFDNNMVVPANKSGRMIATYIDDPTAGTVTDYTGAVRNYREETAIHFEDSEYTLSMDNYLAYINSVRWKVN